MHLIIVYITLILIRERFEILQRPKMGNYEISQNLEFQLFARFVDLCRMGKIRMRSYRMGRLRFFAL